MDEFQASIKNELRKMNNRDLERIRNNLNSYSIANEMMASTMKIVISIPTSSSSDWGRTDKANKIIDALREVPVEERALLFSDSKSKTQAVINVENACAEHSMPSKSSAEATIYTGLKDLYKQLRSEPSNPSTKSSIQLTTIKTTK